MGLGKTFQALLYWKRHLPKDAKVIIICPATIKWNWEKEIKMHLNERAVVLEGRKPTLAAKEAAKNCKFLILNYEIVGETRKRLSWANFLKKQKATLLIIDECHKIKNSDAKMTRHVQKLSRSIPKVICISGTPIVNKPPEIWTTLNIIDEDLFPSFGTFAGRYSNPNWTPWGMQYKGARRLKELHKLLKKVCMVRRLKKNVMKDLPPKTRTVIPIHLPPKAMRQYKMAEDDFRNWLGKYHPSKKGKKFKAERLVKLGYLKRLAAQLKLVAVREWIDNFMEETDEKVIVAGVHKFVVRDLNEQYREVSTRIDGSVIGKKRQGSIDAFNNNKRTRIMFANIRAGGVGWNGVSSSTVMFAELDWVPALHVQMEDRTHRIGQKKKVQVFYLVAAGTIEEYLCQINQQKQAVIDSALDGAEQDDSIDLFDQLTEYLENN